MRVKAHFGVVWRLRASGAVFALTCRGRSLPYFSYQNGISGDVRKSAINICVGVQFVMD
jgi:hypothetical protein